MIINKRKGFMSLEMLLVIGVLVAGLAGVFAIYKKIQANNASMQLTQDIATIVNGLDRFKGATGGYPHNATSAAFNSDTLSGSGKFNEGNTYIDSSTGSKWEYRTVADSSFDDSTGTATGYVIIKTSQAKYSALKKTEIRDILRGKCLNGTKKLEGVAVEKISSDTSECVISANTQLYK